MGRLKPTVLFKRSARGGFPFYFRSGPVDAATGDMQSEAGVQEQTRLVLQHLQTILRGCGADLKDVVKCSVFLSDAQDFGAMNEVYAEVFGAFSRPHLLSQRAW